MADSLKNRVGRVIAGSVHALVDRIENQAPEAVMEQSIREVDTVITDVRHELGLVSANRHLAQQQHSHLNAQHETLTEQTRQALAADRDDLARAAVARQLDIEAQIPVLETNLAEQVRKEEELKGYVTALLAKKRQMAEALDDFVRSRAPATPQGAASGTGAPSQNRLDAATDSFDRLYQRHTGLSPSAAGATLEQAARLKDLEELVRKNQIEERMAQLRTR
ncbi:PspA/IM30 family protein [Acidovorax sp. GBBC 3334]|uniref:PspA/IM30 family protein n=1 Tax=unclassified Acidovorax TaxID=2684926 RepID=UPI0023049540|nr:MULTISPECIES: PspA/IM30 family protein [unclassified Acidovorax]MDA8456488.1 PspA/IM30 family protein [Acidovorax sp. GBBC 3334]MDA8523582.1 PspA/IM30 family protein [Acidovorax sp. NCPPB 4044]